MRTKEHIKAQIEGLEKMKQGIPETGAGGLNNHAQIDAQIAVLKEEKTAHDFEDFYDDLDDGDENGMYIYHAAVDAERWLHCLSNEENLFEEMWFPENVERRANNG